MAPGGGGVANPRGFHGTRGGAVANPRGFHATCGARSRTGADSAAPSRALEPHATQQRP